MDRLQRWFGGKEKETTPEKQQSEQKPVVAEENPLVHGMPIFPEFLMKTKPSDVPPQSAKPDEPSQPAPEPKLLVDIPKDASVTETGIGQLMNQGREMILKVVPLREGDCLSCKLIGSVTMWAAAGFVLFNSGKAKARYAGSKRTYFTIQAWSLTTALVLLGTARFLT